MAFAPGKEGSALQAPKFSFLSHVERGESTTDKHHIYNAQKLHKKTHRYVNTSIKMTQFEDTVMW